MKIVINKIKTLSEMANLSKPELAKYSYRVPKLIEKIMNNSPFETVDGQMVTIDYDAIKSMPLKDGQTDPILAILHTANVVFPTTDGKTIKLTQLKKTKEFGGEEAGKRTAKEAMAMGELQNLIKDALKTSSSDSIEINIKDEAGNIVLAINGVIGVEKQEKVGGIDPKADFLLIRENGMPTIFISHKDGTNPKKFGQWGGVTKKAGENIENHPEIIKFANDIKSNENLVYTIKYYDRTEYEIKRGVGTIGRAIQDPKLKLLGMFGSECLDQQGNLDRQSAGNPQRVDIIAQGMFKLQQDPSNINTFDLFCNHIITRKGFKEENLEGGYTPWLVARYMTGRYNHGLRNTRIAIYPEVGRKITTKI